MKEVKKIETGKSVLISTAIGAAVNVAARCLDIFLLSRLDPDLKIALYSHFIANVIVRTCRAKIGMDIAKYLMDSMDDEDEIQIDIEPKEKVLTLTQNKLRKG